MHRFEDFGPEIRAALLSEAANAERLASDLRKIADSLQIDAALLADAPVFGRYFFSSSKIVSCMGALFEGDQPKGCLSHTDEIIVDARSHGWIRTRTGFYRLGREVHPFGQ